MKVRTIIRGRHYIYKIYKQKEDVPDDNHDIRRVI
jgi:hypothetical protein